MEKKANEANMGDMTLWWASSKKIKRVKLNGIDSLLAFSTPKQKKLYIFSNTLCQTAKKYCLPLNQDTQRYGVL